MSSDHVSNKDRESRMVREALVIEGIKKERAADRKRRKAEAELERPLVRQALAEAEKR